LIQIGMMPLGQQPVGSANLLGRAVAVQAKRGVVVELSALQFPILPGKSDGVSIIAGGAPWQDLHP
jgi:hypothetical protein